MQFDEAWGHHGQIRQHVALANHHAKGLQRTSNSTTSLDGFLVRARSRLIPAPRVPKCLYLGSRTASVLLCEKHVVRGVRVERRVQINEVYGLVGNVPAEHVEVVPIVEDVLRHQGARAIGGVNSVRSTTL